MINRYAQGREAITANLTHTLEIRLEGLREMEEKAYNEFKGTLNGEDTTLMRKTMDVFFSVSDRRVKAEAELKKAQTMGLKG